MRILNIHFKNINSLEGEGRVRFDQGPIAESGVFAITGPNGSGKTSILDVITLGLYGETFRFDKPAEHIITRHTDDAFAEVDFAFDGMTYRAGWRASRGHAALPEMTLTRLGEIPQILAETPYQVRNCIAELTGLDFQRFCKAIVLPQGDFAAFLRALDSERLDILEKISGDALYAEYQRQVQAEHDQLQARHDELAAELELIPLLEDAALEAAEHDLLDHRERCAELEDMQRQLRQQIQAAHNLAALESRRDQSGARRRQLQQQIDRHRADLQRLNAVPAVATLQPDLQLLERMQAETGQSREMLQSARAELGMLQRQLAESGAATDVAPPDGLSLAQQKQQLDQLKLKVSEAKLELPRLQELAATIAGQLELKQTTLQENQDWLAANSQDAQLLTAFPDVVKLRNLRSELAELHGLQKAQHGLSKKSTTDLKKHDSAISATGQRVRELQDLIANNRQTLVEIADGHTLDELREMLADQQSRLQDFEQLLALANVNARLSQRKNVFGWFGGKQPVVLVEEDETVLEAEVEQLKQEVGKELNIARALEQAIEAEQILKKLSDLRSKLVTDKPCYLCGSTDHPYSRKPPLLTDSKKALADQRARTQLIRSLLNDAEKRLLAARKRNKQLTAKQKFLLQKHAEWVALANRLNVFRDGLRMEDIGAQEKLLLREADDTDRLRRVVEDHVRLEREILKAEAEIADKQGSLGLLKLAAEQLAADQADHGPELAAIEQRHRQCVEEHKALLAELEPQLQQLGEKLPKSGKENPLFDRLNARRQDYQIRDLRRQALVTEIADLNQQLQVAQSTMLRMQEDVNANLMALQREERLGLHLAVLEKQQLLIVLEQATQEHERALAAFAHVLQARCAAQDIADIDTLRELLGLAAEQAQIQARLGEMLAHADGLEIELAALDAQLQQEAALLGAGGYALDDLNAIVKYHEQQLDIARQEIDTLEHRLAKQAQARQRHELLADELAACRQRFAVAAARLQQISADPAGFRQTILQMQTDNLLARANQILERISGRYYLRQGVAEHGLALEIEDSRQQNVRRLPATLSGGEIFVVSLALALALAEIANNGKAIESLFVDEGFGNLDADALYLAIGALENLKTQGRTVGVISHVEGVKKRIKTQIELVKKPNGLSELKMVA